MNATVVAEQTALKNVGLNVSVQGDVQVVNARDLHSELLSKRQFANWINDKIKNYGFIEGIDFNKIVKPHENNKTEYILFLNTAKEIAMVENNEAGRKIRRYLIEIEKRYKQEMQIERTITFDTIDNKPNKRHKDKYFTLKNCNGYKKIHATIEGFELIEKIVGKKIICT